MQLLLSIRGHAWPKFITRAPRNHLGTYGIIPGSSQACVTFLIKSEPLGDRDVKLADTDQESEAPAEREAVRQLPKFPGRATKLASDVSTTRGPDESAAVPDPCRPSCRRSTGTRCPPPSRPRRPSAPRAGMERLVVHHRPLLPGDHAVAAAPQPPAGLGAAIAGPSIEHRGNALIVYHHVAVPDPISAIPCVRPDRDGPILPMVHLESAAAKPAA